MNFVDYLILIIILLSLILGVVRGFVRELIALIFWILAFGVAIYFSPWLADKLVNSISQANVRIGVCFIGLFIIVLLLGAWFNSAVGKSMNPSGRSTGNRAVGGLFGLLRGILLVSVLILAGRVIHLDENTGWQESKLIPYLSFVSDQVDKLYNLQVTRYANGIVENMHKQAGK